jgi:hypothetical protein
MSAVQPAQTVLEAVPWVKTLLDYTDKVVACIPENADTIRPTDPNGGWVMSAFEQALHIVDERWELAGTLTGQDHRDRMFLQEYGGTAKPWRFKSATRAEVLDSLAGSRQLVDEVLGWPQSVLAEPTDGTRAAFQQRLAAMREQGKDTAQAEAAGPSTLINLLLFLNAHEQGHRAVLQHMLRMHGVEVVRLA